MYKKVAVGLGILSGILVGIIVGYFVGLKAATKPDFTHRPHSPNETACFVASKHKTDSVYLPAVSDPYWATARRELLFTSPPGHNQWPAPIILLETGPAQITGTIKTNGEPLRAVRIALLIAPDRISPYATTAPDGSFVIHIHEGTYYLNGFLLRDLPEVMQHQIFINAVEQDMDRDPLLHAGHAANVAEKFKVTSERSGLVTGVNEVFFPTTNAYNTSNRFEMVLREEPLELGTLQYRDPIQLVFPRHRSQISGDDLIFSWKPVQGAQKYNLYLNHVNNSSTRSLTHRKGIDATTIAAKDLSLLGDTNPTDSLPLLLSEEKLTPGNTYNWRVIALGGGGRVISASSDETFRGPTFTLRR